MPSHAVDIAWHEMILMTRTYHHFCERAFGYYLHHSPEAVMDEPMRDGLARTLAAVERNQALTMAGVPMLFAIDGELDLAGGQAWAAADIDALRDHQRYIDPGSGHGVVGRRRLRRLLDRRRRRRWRRLRRRWLRRRRLSARARRRRTPARGERTRAG